MVNVAQETERAISGVIKVDEKEIRDHLDGLAFQSVEDTLNALLNVEADAAWCDPNISLNFCMVPCEASKLQFNGTPSFGVASKPFSGGLFR